MNFFSRYETICKTFCRNMSVDVYEMILKWFIDLRNDLCSAIYKGTISYHKDTSLKCLLNKVIGRISNVHCKINQIKQRRK